MKKVPSQERRRRSADDRSDKKFDSAVDRLERAIDDLVETSPGDEKATEYVERAGRRLRTEARRRRREERPPRRSDEHRPRRERADAQVDGRDHDEEDLDDDRRVGAEIWWGSNNWNRRWEWGGRNPSRKLYRDTENEKIGGVCAGIANYYGVEPWVVRCMAVTGLIFMPSVMLPAYWIAYFAMDKPPKKTQRKRRMKRVRRRRREREEELRARDHEPVEEEVFEEVVEEPAHEPRRRPASRAIEAPSQTTELGLHWSPRASLRYIHSDLDEIELRLRRMESHITSGQYELQRELKKIGAES